MQIEPILSLRRTKFGMPGDSKKRVLEALANLIANDLPILNSNELFHRLIARERLGSTGIGMGIAIPHCRIENCTGTFGALITLNKPINYDAIDGEPVDILFALLVPEEAQDEHLQTLASLAEKLNNSNYRASLREAKSDQSLYECAIAIIAAP